MIDMKKYANPGHLLLQLRKDGIKISIEDLNEVIKLYNDLMDFTFEIDESIEDKRFSFVDNNPKLDSGNGDNYLDIYYSIFVKLIKVWQLKLFHCLDYKLLINRIKCDVGTYNSLNFLYTYLMDVLDNYGTCDKEQFMHEFTDRNWDIITDCLSEYKELILSSKCVPYEYKIIIITYDAAYETYYEDSDDYDEYSHEINYDGFLDATFLYFLLNDLLYTETDTIISFIAETRKNMWECLDKINLSGINGDDYLLDYIDALYNRFKDNRNIK